MRNQPSIVRVRPQPGLVLQVEWSDGEHTTVDLTEVVNRHAGLARLRDPAAFSTVEVTDWGWAVRWVKDLDIAARTLRRLGLEQSGVYMRMEEFQAWRSKLGLTQEQAALALGLSRRMVRYYESGERPIPKTVRLACRGYDLERAA